MDMEIENESTETTENSAASTETESTTTENPASTPESESQATHTEATSTDGATEAAASLAAATPNAYKPNFSFRVKDKELQFEPWAQGLIKDAETEKKVREMHEKAFGLDDVKADRQTVKQQLHEVTTKYRQIENGVQALHQLAKEKKYGQFFESLGIPKADVLRYAVEEFKYLELPAEEKARIDAQRQREEAFQALQSQNSLQQQKLQQIEQAQVQREFESAIARPAVTSFAQSFDARVGKPGAFADEVIKRGVYHELVTGQSPTPQQIVDEVVNLLGGYATQAPTQSQVQPQSNAAGISSAPKPTIPAFAGQGGRSPAKKGYTSIDQLKKRRQELANQNAEN